MLALCTDSLSNYGLNRIFRFAKKAGFDGIEIALTKDFDTQNAEYIAELVDEYKLPVVAVSAPRKTTKKKVLAAIEMAKKLNCQIVVVQPPDLLNFSLASWLKKEIPLTRKKEQMHICLENSDAKTFFGILPQYAMNSVADLKSFNAVSIDTANVVSKKLDLMKVYDQLKGVIYHIHLADATTSKSHIFPGKGVVPLESLLTKLKVDDYKYAISLRVHEKSLHPGDDKKVVAKLTDAREFYEKYFGKK